MPKLEEKRVKKIKEVFLKSLTEGATFTKACEGAGINRSTIWRWRREDEAFDDEINFVIDARVQEVEDALFLNATEKNNVTAQIFWLKNRAKEKWSDRFEHSEELKGEITMTDARQKILNRINSIATKRRKKKDNK